MASFDYAPLDQTTRSIRLLRFEDQPTGVDLICCCLETYDIDHCPLYAALSYVWGEEAASNGILIDGKPFLARPNLHAALCAMRDFEDRDKLWVKTSLALTEFASHQTDLPELLATLKSHTPKERWLTVTRKVLTTNYVMIRKPNNGYNYIDQERAHWEIFESMMGYDEDTWTDHEAQSISEWSHRYYWIDAICIDQENDLERGHQVNMMGGIFRGAVCVIAWLGPSSPASDRIMQAVTQRSWPPVAARRRFLNSISNRSYWFRLWTAQEFILARDVVFVCGRRKAPLEFFEGLGQGNEGRMFDRMRTRIALWNRRDVHLGIAIALFAQAHCSDARDRVYGILSLVRDDPQEVPPLQPDYTITEKQLYFKILNRRHQSAPELLTTPGLRNILKQALRIGDDHDIKMAELLYAFIGRVQGLVHMLDSVLREEPRISSYREFLRKICDSSCEPRVGDDDEQNPQDVYREVLDIFSGFPKDEDPVAWDTFEKLLKHRLGLESTI